MSQLLAVVLSVIFAAFVSAFAANAKAPNTGKPTARITYPKLIARLFRADNGEQVGSDVTMEYKHLSSHSDGYYATGKADMFGRKFQCQQSAILIGSKADNAGVDKVKGGTGVCKHCKSQGKGDVVVTVKPQSFGFGKDGGE